MKTIFRLLCGWMAIALAACTGDELQQIEPLQKPVAQKTISVKAYTPSEQAATRLAFEDKGAEGLKLSWTAGDAFTAVIGEGVTFTYDTENGEFTADVNENFELSNGTIAYYPAYDGENFEMDLSQQTGQLNGATTYMEGVYEGDAFRFTHSTAILKATFSGLPQNAVISSIQISGAVDITIANYNSSAAAYINLPAIPKDGQLKFMVETATRVYTATKTVTAEAGIKTGVYYNTTVELQEACLLPTGDAIYGAIRAVDGYENATSIVFEANVADETPATRSDSNYTIALAGNVLTISTPLSEFVFNANCSGMFYYLNKIQSIDFGNCVNTSKVVNMDGMFNRCSSLTSLDLSNFNTSNVMFMHYMFDNCSSLESLNVSSFNTEKVMFMNHMFNNCSSLNSLNVSSFNTSNVMYMNHMFNSCSALTSLNVSSFNTEKVTNMCEMFSRCSSLTSLDLRNFNTANVTDMYCMFNECSALTLLDLSNFNTSKVTDMNFMFFQCSALTSLNVSSFNTAKVTDMASMFYGCSLLTSLDLSSFDTSKVTTMDGMFYDCFSIAELKLINFDFGNVTYFDDMFYDLARNDAETVPVYVHVTQDSYNILKNKDTGINSAYAWFVDENGIKYED